MVLVVVLVLVLALVASLLHEAAKGLGRMEEKSLGKQGRMAARGPDRKAGLSRGWYWKWGETRHDQYATSGRAWWYGRGILGEETG